MITSSIINGLNDEQRQVVSAAPGNYLVLAGAGSGKTRVLVHRIAWLVQALHVSPYAILAVTFTNKAAAEMKQRIDALIPHVSRTMWCGTFHGLCHRLLRTHHLEAGLSLDFQILDGEDQQRLLKRLIKAQNLDEKQWPVRQAAWFINGHKDEGRRPEQIRARDGIEQTWLRIYSAYQQTCDRANLLDFAEILLRSYELLSKNPALCAHYQQRFSHILVDEFQDTNAIQYAWLKILAGTSSNVLIVGDDDQSIYGWRGAKIANIGHFLQDFAQAQTIRLEQNYRSTSTILDASNHLIANNLQRMGKQLWTQGAKGEPISVYSAFNELDEARFVANKLADWQENGGKLQDCAVLYRSNAQSRVLEEALLQARLPYRIYGGMRFFERQEIKDALAYLRLINNRLDDVAFERVINVPARGIGEKTLDFVRTLAREQGKTLWQASRQLVDEKALNARMTNMLEQFLALIDELEDETREMSLFALVEQSIKRSGLQGWYASERGEKGQARVENLAELVNAAREFSWQDEEAQTELGAFLSHAALEAGEGQADKFADAVQMMTLHSAKGLEFPLVFLVGLEEGLFPSQLSQQEAGRIEEERRLCYVGLTRAMQKLYISYAQSRRIYGKETLQTPSRFIQELPAHCVEEIRLRAKVSYPLAAGRFAAQIAQENLSKSRLSLGCKVNHPKFGLGKVVDFSGAGEQSRVQVSFFDHGLKWLVVQYARLEVVG
ncbi:MAG: DNA helicase II [Vibrionaceae bacterium]